ncbi:MAG: hypothetical protein HY303_10195 [Candidatus Wallbacteria bacterium]|nr:hypothetical protein [Candidatus Wallbacteria bacterium]
MRVAGLDEAALRAAQVRYVGADGGTLPLERTRTPGVWESAQSLTGGRVVLSLPAGQVAAIRGLWLTTFGSLLEWTPGHPPLKGRLAANGLVELELQLATSRRGASSATGSMFTLPLLWASLLLLSALTRRLVLRRKRLAKVCSRALGLAPETAPTGPGRAWPWCAAGLLVVSISLAGVERLERYYFAQDDSLVEALPVILEAYHGLGAGRFPTWSPGQLLGAPTTEIGLYGLAYPPTFLSCWIASRVLGDERRALDVFAWLHLLVGYMITFRFGRTAGLRPPMAAALGLSFVLSGALLIGGRCHFLLLPVAVWAPWLALAAARLRTQGDSWRWLLSTGIAIGLDILSGHPQLWVYSLLCFVFAAALQAAAGELPSGRLVRVLATLTLGVGLGSPLLVPQLQSASRVHWEEGGTGSGLARKLGAMLLPSPLVGSLDPYDDSRLHAQVRGQFYFSGTVLTGAGLAAVAALCGALLDPRWRKRLAARNVWLLVGAAALLIGMGKTGVVWNLLAVLPGFSSFREPFRLLPFATLFLATGGGLALQRAMGTASRAGRWEQAVFATVGLLMLYHASIARSSFTHYGFRPYPTMDPLVTAAGGKALLDATHRLLPMANRDSEGPGLCWTLKHNLPSAYGLLSIDGYCSLVPGTAENIFAQRRIDADPVAAMKAYGVRWALEDAELGPLNPDSEPAVGAVLGHGVVRGTSFPLLGWIRRRARPLARLPLVTVWELPEPSPLAFAANRPLVGLPVEFRCDGATVDLSSLSGLAVVVLNVLKRPWMSVWGDGRPLVAQVDDWGRLQVHVPSGTRFLEMRYRPPWEGGLAVGLALVLASLALARVTHGRSEQR